MTSAPYLNIPIPSSFILPYLSLPSLPDEVVQASGRELRPDARFDSLAGSLTTVALLATSYQGDSSSRAQQERTETVLIIQDRLKSSVSSITNRRNRRTTKTVVKAPTLPGFPANCSRFTFLPSWRPIAYSPVTKGASESNFSLSNRHKRRIHKLQLHSRLIASALGTESS